MPDATIDDSPCARCGYDLRGVADEQPCPECGLLAERSRQRSEHLSDATPGWLLGLAVGAAIVLAAHLLALVWIPAFELMRELLRPSYAPQLVNGQIAGYARSGGVSLTYGQWQVVYLAGFDLAAVLLIVGAWMISRPERNALAANADRRLRWTLRASAFPPLVALGVAHGLLFAQGYLGGFEFEWPQLTVLALLTLGSAPLPVLLFVLLRRLAIRVLHPRLAEHATIVAVGYAATLVAMPLSHVAYAFGETYGGTYWSGRSAIALAITLTMVLLVILFGGWTALNCARFILAFARAYRGANRKWAAADRSAADRSAPHS